MFSSCLKPGYKPTKNKDLLTFSTPRNFHQLRAPLSKIKFGLIRDYQNIILYLYKTKTIILFSVCLTAQTRIFFSKTSYYVYFRFN